MDSHGWQIIYKTVQQMDRTLPQTGRKKRYSDVLIVAMFIWAAAHDRPMCWACRRDSYYGPFRPNRRPSVSQFSRRLRSARCQQILQEVERLLAQTERVTPVSFLDGRPLVVGPCSKDRTAKAGRIYGGFARGYKLHAIVSQERRVRIWSLTPLNVGEPPEAMKLVEQTALGDWLLADGNYDSNILYDAAARGGCQLLTPVPWDKSLGHRYQSPARLRAIELWRSGQATLIYRQRVHVEGCFGNQSSFGGGLAPLPAWVRTLPRVRNWVTAKLIIYHARLQTRHVA